MGSEELCGCPFPNLAGSCLQYKTNKFVIGGDQTFVVDFQKDQCGFQTDSFIPIDERMIHHQMIKISGRPSVRYWQEYVGDAVVVMETRLIRR